MRISGIVAFLLVTAHVPVSLAQQAPRPGAIFAVKTNEFWLNLHHFLYVLGQAQEGHPRRCTRDQAFAALVAKAAAASPP